MVWFILVQIIPHAMSAIAIFLSVLVSVGVGVLFLIDTPKGLEDKGILKLIVGVVMLLVAVFIVGFILLFKRRIRLMGLFLAWST